MVSPEIWLSLAKLVHCNEGAGGNRGAWGTFAPPQILAELEAKFVPSKDLVLVLSHLDFKTFRRLCCTSHTYYVNCSAFVKL